MRRHINTGLQHEANEIRAGVSRLATDHTFKADDTADATLVANTFGHKAAVRLQVRLVALTKKRNQTFKLENAAILNEAHLLRLSMANAET